MKYYTLLSLDVEEFDMPLEYNNVISTSEQFDVSKAGLDNLIPIWEKCKIATTLFTTADYAQHFPADIKVLSEKHEIASHTFFHSKFEIEHLTLSKKILEDITGKSILGLRMPRMCNVDMAAVHDAGYTYDSSINPTYIPGRYNNFRLPRTLHQESKIMRIPASVSPNLRLPLFWLGFKNYPYWYFLKLCLQTLKKDGYLCLYFHPWEFTDISKYKVPNFTKNPSGKVMLDRFERLLNDLSKYSDFITIETFLKIKNFL